MGNILLFFSRKELAVVLAVGVGTGLADHQLLSLLFASVARIDSVMQFNFYLANIAGGPLFGDFLQTWLEYGAVFAACLVRKPAAGTIALTINGLCQVFVYHTHDPHLLYGFSGLGADVVFALFRYKRYDVRAISLAGMASGVFWYVIVWPTHSVPIYPVSFIIPDFVIRVLGSAVGDGLFGAALAWAILSLIGRKWSESPTLAFGDGRTTRLADEIGVIVAVLGVLLMLLTSALPPVSSFFLSIGPNIPAGIPQSEEYNPGYVIGVLLVFLSLTMLAFWHLRSRYSGDNVQTESLPRTVASSF